MVFLFSFGVVWYFFFEGCGVGRGGMWRCERWKETKEETEGVVQATWEARGGSRSKAGLKE